MILNFNVCIDTDDFNNYMEMKTLLRDQFKIELVSAALTETKGNVDKASKIIKMNRVNVFEVLKQFAIKRVSFK